MTCIELEGELVNFHFGAVDDDRRAAIEAHLGTCPACVGELLAVKRAIETADRAGEPSAAMTARVRTAVVAAMPPRARRWERAAAFAFACAALVASLAASHALLG